MRSNSETPPQHGTYSSHSGCAFLRDGTSTQLQPSPRPKCGTCTGQSHPSRKQEICSTPGSANPTHPPPGSATHGPGNAKKTCMVQRWRRRIRKSLMSMWRRDGKPSTPTARRRSIRRREWWEGLGYISGITGTRHSASPPIRNKQITGESSSRPYMPFAIGHSTSAH